MFVGRLIIGLAGGIGSGKSHVARLLESLGCCRVDSDEMVRAAYTHPEVKRAVTERFGVEVLLPDGQVDRKAIASIVFRDAAQRQWLEKLLHPVANHARVALMEQAAHDPAIVAYVWDSPLLFETNLNEICDVVWFVEAPREDRLRRVAERGWDEAELDRRENAQWPIERKLAACDARVVNSEADPATKPRLAEMLAPLTEIGSGCCGGASAGGCGNGSRCGCSTSCSSGCSSVCGGGSTDAGRSKPDGCCQSAVSGQSCCQSAGR